MKHLGSTLTIFVITTVILISILNAQANDGLDAIKTKYKACIKNELEAASNGDGTYDEVFFLEGKAHCGKIETLMIQTAKAKSKSVQLRAEISELTDQLIAGAKQELGLK